MAAAAVIPIALVGLGLMIYNLNCGSIVHSTSGVHYQLNLDRQIARSKFFSVRYLWFNFRIYFLEPARWSSQLPFVHGIRVPPVACGSLAG
jgi:hypothetical protein